jgi:hypothetical protein
VAMRRTIIGAPPATLDYSWGRKNVSGRRTPKVSWKIEQRRIDMARGGELDGEDGMNRALAGWNVTGEVRIAMIEMQSILQMDAKMTYERAT